MEDIGYNETLNEIKYHMIDRAWLLSSRYGTSSSEVYKESLWVSLWVVSVPVRPRILVGNIGSSQFEFTQKLSLA